MVGLLSVCVCMWRGQVGDHPEGSRGRRRQVEIRGRSSGTGGQAGDRVRAPGEGGAKILALVFLRHFPGLHIAPHVTFAQTSHTVFSHFIIFLT